MLPILIGVSGGILTIVLFILLKGFDKKMIYGLILSGIGFLYVGFLWSDRTALLITGAQAILFVILSYYGVKKSKYILAAGFFLHGIWDLLYNYLNPSDLVPPHYDLFCLSIDWTMGLYILFLGNRFAIKRQRSKEGYKQYRMPVLNISIFC